MCSRVEQGLLDPVVFHRSGVSLPMGERSGKVAAEDMDGPDTTPVSYIISWLAESYGMRGSCISSYRV
ncbi:hypothetical protein SKAU_G00017620 [Synaphobranchus kaupii]|uniref:Uncharacterized protein n=1 Tax=Synaphobranchus kaupii TaxID=118154 RepID=A0A9Q1JE60_SYNKA|nr:hypothetical protein SKAU_G00017620 [Synaphobranchus kaupii]